MEQSGPDQVASVGLSLATCRADSRPWRWSYGGWAKKISPSLVRAIRDLLDLSGFETGREDYREEPAGEVTPGPEGRIRRRAQESLALQSTQ